MKEIQVFGIGAGGHARVVLSALRLIGEYEPVCLLDADPGLHGTVVGDVSVEGGDSMVPELMTRGMRLAFNGVGSAGDNSLRSRMFSDICDAGVEFIDVVHPHAFVDSGVQYGEGLQVMACGVVSCGAVTGRNVLINTGALVEHDCGIGDNVVVSSGAVICGGCSVGDDVFIGAGAVIREGVSLGKGVVVGAGAVVLRDVSDGMRVAGVPARPIGESLKRRES